MDFLTGIRYLAMEEKNVLCDLIEFKHEGIANLASWKLESAFVFDEILFSKYQYLKGGGGYLS